MNKRLSFLAFCILALAAFSAAQDKDMGKDKGKDERRSVAQVLDRTVMNIEHDFVPAAEAMPEDKFGFAPSNGEFKGVRTFGEQVKHVAAVNYIYGAAILGEKVPVDVGDESGPASVKTKAEILGYLKDSFTYVHKAMATINEKNLVEPVKSPFGEGMVTRLGLATSVVAHGFDHYGQMVEYLRMNGIVPPASR
ncbi:MAG: DinB family protein [Candidatus Sulfotelmatobacter sp.]